MLVRIGFFRMCRWPSDRSSFNAFHPQSTMADNATSSSGDGFQFTRAPTAAATSSVTATPAGAEEASWSQSAPLPSDQLIRLPYRAGSSGGGFEFARPQARAPAATAPQSAAAAAATAGAEETTWSQSGRLSSRAVRSRSTPTSRSKQLNSSATPRSTVRRSGRHESVIIGKFAWDRIYKAATSEFGCISLI